MITLNQNLAAPFSKDASQKMPKPPYIASFGKDNQQLHYIAACHTEMTKDERGRITSYKKNPAIAVLEEEIARYQPDFIVFEGPDYMGKTHHAHPKERMGDPNYKAQIVEESLMASYLAQKNGIPYQGGEPDDRAMFQEMKQKGYSAKEVMAMYALREVPNYNQDGKRDVNKEEFKRYIEGYLQNYPYFKSLPENERLSYEEFEAWFDEHKPNKAMSPQKITTRDIYAGKSKNSSYFENAMVDLIDVREANINKVIQNAFQRHKKVLVIYGAGHLPKSLPVYEAAFGKASYQSFATKAVNNSASTSPLNSKNLLIASIGLGVASILLSFTVPLAIAGAASLVGSVYLKTQEDRQEKKSAGEKQLAARKTSPSTNTVKEKSRGIGINYRNDFVERFAKAPKIMERLR
jgi:hypothetical protein